MFTRRKFIGTTLGAGVAQRRAARRYSALRSRHQPLHAMPRAIAPVGQLHAECAR